MMDVIVRGWCPTLSVLGPTGRQVSPMYAQGRGPAVNTALHHFFPFVLPLLCNLAPLLSVSKQ